MLKDPNLVKYSNKVVRSAQRLSLLEQRIIFSAIAKTPLSKEITSEDVFYLRLEELKDLGGRVSNDTYQQLKDASVNLMRRLITLAPCDREKGMTWVFPWCQAAGYNEEKKMIAIQFSSRVIPFLKAVRQKFIQYDLEEITGFRSVYTQPLYARLMLHMREKTNGAVKQTWSEVIPLDELRLTLDAENYKSYGQLKLRVLDTATKQINESVYTRFSVKWTPDEKTKIGKKITAVKFKMTLKKQHLVADSDPDKDTLDIFSGITTRQATLTEKQIDMLADWLSGAHGSKRLENNGSSVSEVYEFLRRNKAVPMSIDANNLDEYRAFFTRRLVEPEFVKLLSRYIERAGFNFS